MFATVHAYSRINISLRALMSLPPIVLGLSPHPNLLEETFFHLFISVCLVCHDRHAHLRGMVQGLINDAVAFC